MTISSIVPATPSQSISLDIDTAVLAKSLDIAEASGQDLIKMMEQSVNPDLGNYIDYKA